MVEQGKKSMNRKPFTIKIDSELLDKIKDIVYNEYGFTLTKFIEDILREHIEEHYPDVPARPTGNVRPGRKFPDCL